VAESTPGVELAEAPSASGDGPGGLPVTRVLHQRLRYTYAAPVRNLRHRLIVVPRMEHGGECRLAHRVSVTGAEAHLASRTDSFANHVIDVWAPVVGQFIEFEAWAVVRRHDARPAALHVGAASDPRLLRSTALTRTDDALVDAIRSMGANRSGTADPRGLAERVCTWAHGALRYEYGVTTVRTTAGQALAGGVGVCQDYAHLMVAMCRALGIASRYVSGHLAGQGGSHAWVEVLVPSPAGVDVVAFDPTNDRHAGYDYLTVAVGRDYADVAPTSGAFEGDGTGVLHATKRLGTVGSAPDMTALAG